MADDQLAALWALNLEQEEEYQAKVDTPPGSAPHHSPIPLHLGFVFMACYHIDVACTTLASRSSAEPFLGLLCRGPRFQKFMEEFQQEQQGSAEAAGAAGTVHMRSKI